MSLSISRLKEYQRLLNLSNWEIDLIEEKTLESYGLTKMICNDYQAIIKIKSELSKEEKEKTLIHELIHLIHRDELDIIVENIKEENIIVLYERFHERAIEQMAKIIYQLVHNEHS